MTESAKKPDRALIGVLSIIGVLIIVSLAVVFSRGAAPLRDEATPEGIVQRYSAAVLAGDERAAAAYLTEGATDACDEFFEPSTARMRVTLVSTTERVESADVTVSITTSYDGGLFGGSEYTEDATFDLVSVNGDWLIESTPW
jgi:hypothetical protein